MGDNVQLEVTSPPHRELLIQQALGFLGNRDPGYVERVKQRLERGSTRWVRASFPACWNG